MTGIGDGTKDPAWRGQGTDRGRSSRPNLSLDYLDGTPAAIVLDRFPVPILSVHRDGFVVYTNRAFAEMLGYRCRDLVDVCVDRILIDGAPNAGSACLRTKAGAIVDLRHRGGWTVHAVVSRSALVRDDDPIGLVAFHDVTEQIWACNSFEPDPSWGNQRTCHTQHS